MKHSALQLLALGLSVGITTFAATCLVACAHAALQRLVHR